MVTFRDDLSCGMLYSVEEIYKAFPNQMEIAPKVLQERVKPTLNLENNFWRNAGELDNKSMLEELSGTSWVN